MNKIISYSFLILFLFAFSCKTISSLLPLEEKGIALMQDCDCEKGESESEKSSEKDERKEVKDFSEFLFHKNTFAFILNGLSLRNNDNFLFIPSHYSKIVHLPPEQVVA